VGYYIPSAYNDPLKKNVGSTHTTHHAYSRVGEILTQSEIVGKVVPRFTMITTDGEINRFIQPRQPACFLKTEH